jgi:hypothetical protein
MKNNNMSKILPLLFVVLITLFGSCSKVSNISKPSGPSHSVVVIHSWDSIGEEKELFSKSMEKAFRDHDMAVEIHHIYANMIHRPNDVFTKFDWPKYSKQIKDWKPEVILLNDDPIVEWLFGREEIEEIQPAIDAAMAEGIIIPEKAPTPPDTIFSKALGGWYDIVVAMYHDQGHIPLKVKGFVYNRELKKWDAVAGVNITLGLPIIRTSVDHGTGEDLAGDGTSNQISLVNAMDYAIRMAHAKAEA